MEFHILGPLEVVRAGRPVHLAGGRQGSLLAALLIHANEVLDSDRLIEAVWADRPPRTARAALQGYVAQLRRLLPAARLETRAGTGYVLVVEQGELDSHRFERLVDEARTSEPLEAAAMLRAALSLWRGPALSGFRTEAFALGEVARLDELRVTAIEQRVEADLALGRHNELVSELERLLAEHPLRERLTAQLMVALYRSGRQAEALNAYRNLRRALVEELGIEPGPALRTLERQILAQDEGLQQAPPVAEAEPPPVSPTGSHPSEHDELRLVTVLFADVVGSSALGERLPPDEVKALVGECVTMMSAAVEEYGGTVQAYQGDGICAYFGVPVAHEDDHERSARAALRILEVVGEYARDIGRAWNVQDFSVRIGVNSGRTAVGLVGAADPQTVALGDATNIAARLESLAAPGTIAVGPETARRLSTRFALEPLGELAVKGREAPVGASRLVGAKARERLSPGTPIAGRGEELARLGTVVDDLVSGRGRVVLLSGEAGIGKTRLLEELRSRAGERVTWLEGRCLSYGGPAAWPFIEMLLGWLGGEIGEPEIALRTKARARLGRLLGDSLDEVLPALGRLLRLRVAEGGDIGQGYVGWLESLAATGPLVVALEDVHWADGPTRELAERVLELTDTAPVALLLSQEPMTQSEGERMRLRASSEFRHRTIEVVLAPLLEADAKRLLDDLLPREHDVDDGMRRRLVREAEGNPLYLEELTRAFLDGALQPRGRTWTITLRGAELLPPALENVLVARIDRLPDTARRLAHAAAAIGRVFPVSVLEEVVGPKAREGLATLLRHEIVRELRRYPEFECSFAHRLLQEAALTTLTAARRRELYGQIAAAFELIYGDSLEHHLERLAHYHAQGGNLPKALEYAERSRARAADAPA